MRMGKGISWKIVPDNIDELLFKGSRDDILKVTEALLKMKKINLEALENARFEKR